MNAHAVLSLVRRRISAAGFAILVPLSAFAVESAPPDALSVKVFPDAYIADGKSFATIAALEAWATPSPMRSLWLDGCGPGSTPSLLAAVERLHQAYAEGGVRIRTFAAGEPACLDAVAPPASPGASGAPLPYYASDRTSRSAIH